MPMRLRNVVSLSEGDCGFASGCGGKVSPSSRSRMLRWDMMPLDYLLLKLSYCRVSLWGEGLEEWRGNMLVNVAKLKNADFLLLHDSCNRPWEMSACKIVM